MTCLSFQYKSCCAVFGSPRIEVSKVTLCKDDRSPAHWCAWWWSCCCCCSQPHWLQPWVSSSLWRRTGCHDTCCRRGQGWAWSPPSRCWSVRRSRYGWSPTDCLPYRLAAGHNLGWGQVSQYMYKRYSTYNIICMSL